MCDIGSYRDGDTCVECGVGMTTLNKGALSGEQCFGENSIYAMTLHY